MTDNPTEADQLQQLTGVLIAIAMGDFSARTPRSGTGDTLDVLAYMVNNVAAEVGEAFAERDRHRSKLAAILDAMADGVLVLNANGVVEHTNPALQSLLRRPDGSMLGLTLRELLVDPAAPKNIAAQVADSGSGSSTLLFRAGTGPAVPLAVNASAMEGELGAMVLVARDERPFAEAEEKIRLYNELRRTQAQLVQSAKLASLGELAGAVAHEINNPLQVLSGLIGFMEEDLRDGADSNPQYAAWLGDVQAMNTAVERCGDVSRRMLTFARGSSGERVEVDLRQVCLETLNLARREIANRERTIAVDLPEPLPVFGDPGELGQIVLNLVLNALDATRPGGRLELSACQRDGHFALTVGDDGQGVAHDDLGRVFDPFFTTKEQGEGTGLGLSVSYGLAEAHGGRLEVESGGVGQGARFSLVLPVRP